MLNNMGLMIRNDKDGTKITIIKEEWGIRYKNFRNGNSK